MFERDISSLVTLDEGLIHMLGGAPSGKTEYKRLLFGGCERFDAAYNAKWVKAGSISF